MNEEDLAHWGLSRQKQTKHYIVKKELVEVIVN